MAKVIYTSRALNDIERIKEFLEPFGSAVVKAATDRVAEAIEMLARHPLLGRRAEYDLRELVVSRGNTGYVALHDFVEEEDVVLIHGVRHQKEAGQTD